MNRILEYLETSAQRFPDKVVFGDETTSLDYKTFVDLSKRIGTAVAKTGAVLRPIMIMMKKTPYTLAAFFGVMYSRNFYVPIDVDMPDDRLQKIVNNLDPEYVICDVDNCEKAKSFLSEDKVLLFDTLASETVDQGMLDAISKSSLDVDPIYIIYTSGTTGTPKGVVIPERALADYVNSFCAEICIDENDVFANQAPFHFDASLIDIFCTVKNGGTMYIVPPMYFTVPMKLVEFLNNFKITAIRWVPSAMKMISVFNVFSEVIPEYLKTVIFGAEAMPTKCYNYWKKYLTDSTFIQIYGPTEITGVCVTYVVDREYSNDQTIPIGKPLGNSGVFLLDEDDRLITDVDVTGEICIYGTCLSLGYYNMPEKTAEVFVQNPVQKNYTNTIYRSGDLAKYNERGEFVFVGRKDYQIKHMGYRIELGEIESAANTVTGVLDSACVFDDKKDKIVLFYTTDSNLDKVTLKTELKTKITSYMMPEKIVVIDELPKNANGKINRLKLKEFL